MTEQLQSDLLELEELKGIRIAVSDDEQALFVGFSYWQKSARQGLCVALLDGCRHPVRRLWPDSVVRGDTSVNTEAEKDNELEHLSAHGFYRKLN
jgi:hypothetical protein